MYPIQTYSSNEMLGMNHDVKNIRFFFTLASLDQCSLKCKLNMMTFALLTGMSLIKSAMIKALWE